jgi:hypothetical protein
MTTAIHSHHGPSPVTEPATFGLIAEFDTPEAVLAAAERAYSEGYRHMEAYSPMPVDGLSEAIGFRRNGVSRLVFIGGVSGAIGGFLMQTFSAVIHYPINIGGRPYFSWPAFIPVTFESGILLAAFSAVFGMLILNGLPRLHHPIFNAPGFERASIDRFFLLVMTRDPKFTPAGTRHFLETLNPLSVSEVEN